MGLPRLQHGTYRGCGLVGKRDYESVGPLTAKKGTLRVPYKCIQVGDRLHQEISRGGGGPLVGGVEETEV